VLDLPTKISIFLCRFSFGSLNNTSTGFGRGLKLNTLPTGGSGFNFGNTLGGSTVSIGSTNQTTSEIEKYAFIYYYLFIIY
jgi:hypothetical protein